MCSMPTSFRQQHIVLEEGIGRVLYALHCHEGGVKTRVEGTGDKTLVPVVLGIRQ